MRIHFYRSTLFLHCLLAGSLLFFASCKSHKETGLQIFRYNEPAGIATLDPAYAKNQALMWPAHQLFNTLVEVDQQLQIKSSVARYWEYSDDKRVITFHLRTDVCFHDDPCFKNSQGRRLVAADVVYSLGRIIDKETASPGAWIFNRKVDSIAPFTAINDSVFVLKLQRPYQPILGILSMQYCSIVPREAVEFYGASFRRHPVGSGPFMFTAWEEGQALILKRNPRYFEKDSAGKSLPYLDGIKVSFLDSRASEFLAFRQQQLDFINDLDVSFKDDVLTRTGNLKKKWEGRIRLQKHPYLNIEYLGILMDSSQQQLLQSPLRLKKFRQAINYAIDRKKLILYLRNSIGTAAESGFVPQGLPSFDKDIVKGFNYDPAKARQLIAEAGFNSDHPSPVVTLLTIPNYAAIGSFLVNELKQSGIEAKVEVVQKSLLIEQTSKSQVAFFRGSWIADYPDAENYLGVFYSKNPAPPNYTRYSNPAYDRLFEQSLAETNDSLRYSLYREMDQLIVNDCPVVPLWYDMILHLVQNNVHGFSPNSLNMLELRYTRKK